MQLKDIRASALADGTIMFQIIVEKVKFSTVQEILSNIGTNYQEWLLSIEKVKKVRGLNANSYFHVLVNKIARALNIGEEEAKVNLVLDYGAIMIDENSEKVGFKLPVSVDASKIYKYTKWFDKRLENGKEFNCYIIYENTHNLDTKQMAKLIDGTVYEAQQLGIETKTPDQIEQLKSLWGKEK